MDTTTVIPANTPAPAAAAPAAVAQSTTPAVPATETPTTQNVTTTTTANEVPADPFDPAYLQKRIDDFMKSKGTAATAATPATDATATPAPAADAAATTDATAATSTEGAANAANGATAEAAASDAAAAPTDASTANNATDLIVDLPPRNANGNPLKIAAPDATTADALRRLNNGYMRGEEARRIATDAEQKLARVSEIEIMLSADPLGLVERMPEAQRVDIARTMLAEHFDALRPIIEKWWDDESERRMERASALEKRADARQSYQSQLTVSQQVRQVSDAVRSLIPDTADGSEAGEFYQDAVTYLANVARTRDTGLVTAAEVPQLLERRIARYGFNKPAANATNATSANAAPASAPAPAAQSAAAPAVSVPAPNVARVHAVNQARAAAAATTTVGAGATPVTTMPKAPKGLTIEQTADWYIQQAKLRAH